MSLTRSYIICATPRSGSTLLCDLLRDSGVAGAPNSFYRQLSIPYWIERWGVTEPMDSPGFDRAYLDAALRAGEADTGMFGMRLMWNGVLDLSVRLAGLFPGLECDAARYDAAFGPTRYLYLSRGDLVAQAVSRYRAEQGGLWHLNADGSDRERIKAAAAPIYDRDAIAIYVEEAKADNQAWQDWFLDQAIVPHCLTYEELAADPGATFAGVLNALGLDSGLADQAVPSTRKLATAESADWVARFKSEMA